MILVYEILRQKLSVVVHICCNPSLGGRGKSIINKYQDMLICIGNFSPATVVSKDNLKNAFKDLRQVMLIYSSKI